MQEGCSFAWGQKAENQRAAPPWICEALRRAGASGRGVRYTRHAEEHLRVAAHLPPPAGPWGAGREATKRPVALSHSCAAVVLRTAPRIAFGDPALPLQGRAKKAPRFAAYLLRLFRVVLGFLAGQDLLGDQAGVLADGRLDAVGDVGIVAQERLGIFAALADALAVVGEP